MARARRDGEGATSWYEPPRRREALRYAACGLVVSAAAALGAEVLTRQPAGPVSTEVPDAVEVDLPPALASSLPRRDTPDGPVRPATEAAPAAPAPPPEPIDEKPPEPPPPEAPDPAAVIRKQPETPPPPPPPAAAAPAAAETAPAGAAVPDAAPVEAEPDAPPPRARAVAAWQRAMVEHIEHAKRGVHRGRHLVGTAEIAFGIGLDGALLAEAVRKSSGNAALDRTALDLVAAAAPFPKPPAGIPEAGLAFTVPVRFR